MITRAPRLTFYEDLVGYHGGYSGCWYHPDMRNSAPILYKSSAWPTTGIGAWPVDMDLDTPSPREVSYHA